MPESKLERSFLLLPQLAVPTRVLQDCFRAGLGARIGQSTVASRKVHTFRPDRPECVTVLSNSDAGRVFYQRRQEGEVCHLDVFHECGDVDHKQLATALRQAVAIYNYHSGLTRLEFFGGNEKEVCADFIDVQTGTGGGRITGSLTYGRKQSLRRAHGNHVHVAAALPGDHLACLFYLVMAVESAVAKSGLELRRNEGIDNRLGGKGAADLSPYSDNSDSFLREKEAAMPETIARHQYRQDLTELADDFDGVEDVRDTLTAAEEGCGERLFNYGLEGRGCGPQVLQRLAGLGLVSVKDGKVSLTEYGRSFLAYLNEHMPDMEAYLRQSFRLLRPPSGSPRSSKLAPEVGSGGSGRRMLLPCPVNGRRGELAVAETVNAAARRMVAEGSQSLRVSTGDLHEFVRKERPRTEICLVIDASASMAGQRIRAAKFLARHLLLTNPDKLSLITFQEEKAEVVLPFTRDWRLGEESLKRIVPVGSTPLASGLQGCIDYLAAAGVRKPLVLLITDGVPTVAAVSRDPVADALAAAGEIKRRGYGFACIGLKAHRRFLAALAEQAGGRVYMLEELEKRALVKTAWDDCVGRYL